MRVHIGILGFKVNFKTPILKQKPMYDSNFNIKEYVFYTKEGRGDRVQICSLCQILSVSENNKTLSLIAGIF